MTEPVRWRGQAAPIWGAAPPPPRHKLYPVFRVDSRQPIKFVLLSPCVEETYTHTADGRTVFCTGLEHGCWLDHVLYGKPRYGAWLAVIVPPDRKTRLLKLTPVAIGTEPRLRTLAGHLRGMRLDVWRKDWCVTSQMHARLYPEELVHQAELPPCPDVRFAVEHMIEASDRPKGATKGNWGPFGRAFRANGGAQ